MSCPEKVSRIITKGRSRSSRAGLLFPIGRIHRLLKRGKFSERVGAHASAYLTAAIEYLAAEILELAGNVAKDCSKIRITPRHLLFAIRNDRDLNKLLHNVIIPQGGVLPHIHISLVLKQKHK